MVSNLRSINKDLITTTFSDRQNSNNHASKVGYVSLVMLPLSSLLVDDTGNGNGGRIVSQILGTVDNSFL